jgi:phage terminase large subunit
LGYKDDTAIWWYQVAHGEIHVIDFHSVSGATIDDIAQTVLAKPYTYGKHNLPHDARAKTLASGGKSIIEQLAAHLGVSKLVIVPELSVQDGIQAARQMLPRTWFDSERCSNGLEALRQYQREYDEDKKAFRERPRHDWTSHAADAFRMLAIAWRAEPVAAKAPEAKVLYVGPQNEVTLNDMWAVHDRNPRRQRI